MTKTDRRNFLKTSGMALAGAPLAANAFRGENNPGNKVSEGSSMSFPSDFLFGVSSAAYQIEGAADEDGKGESIWDRYCKEDGKVSVSGENAADHYHHVREDLALLKELGVKSYRFSIAWTRIFPDGKGKINRKGVDFYRNIIDTLNSHNITPIVTLYHWDLPQRLQDNGGWGNRDTAKYFADYADAMFREFGDRVAYWGTHNEPWVTSFAGHWLGGKAPGYSDLNLALQVSHHLLLSHGLAVQAYRAGNQNGKIGITLDLQLAEPATGSDDDRLAADILNNSHFGWFADPIFKKQYPSDIEAIYRKEKVKLPVMQQGDMDIIGSPVDYLGLNYYYTDRVSLAKDGGWWPYGINTMPRVGRKYKLYSYETFQAEGLYKLLKKAHNDYNGIPLIVTENGHHANDYINHKGEINDESRIEYIYKHIEACHKALSEGINLKGYTIWSFLDDYEWGDYGRMGLVWVDYKNFTRKIKESGRWYARCIANNDFRLI